MNYEYEMLDYEREQMRINQGVFTDADKSDIRRSDGNRSRKLRADEFQTPNKNAQEYTSERRTETNN